MDAGLSGRKVLLDARWLGIGGPGRVTEHLLRGLNELEPDGDWFVWGPEHVEPYLWDGARRVPSRHHPHTLFGQREFPGPRSLRPDLAFYPHQMRPAWRLGRAEVTTIHDTIPFRYPPRPRLGFAMKAFLRRMAKLSDFVSTDSEFSRMCVARDLGVPPERICVLPIPIDHEVAERIRSRREVSDRTLNAVYMGADLPHKNLDRLIEAFAQTAFQQRGGHLTLLGMDESACNRLRGLAEAAGARVDVLGRVSEAQLEDVLSGATLVVQPSLEEGFGLPVAEAMAAGIPVAASSGGSLPEITKGTIEHFDPMNVSAIARAIDEASKVTGASHVTWPSQRDLAEAVVRVCGAVLAGPALPVTGR